MHPSNDPRTTSSTTTPAAPRGLRRLLGRTRLAMAVNLAVLAVLVTGTAAYGVLTKTVTLRVDGRTDTVRTFAGSVDSVLASRDVDVAEADRVKVDGDTTRATPSAPVEDGDTITVQYRRPLTVAVDGRITRTSTHAPTVRKALSDLDITPRSDTRVDRAMSARLPRGGAEIVVSNPKRITVVADGRKRTITTAAPTAAGVVDVAGVRLGDADELSLPRDGYVTKDTRTIRVTRIKMQDKTVTARDKAPVQYRDDDSMPKGETKVLEPGSDGRTRQQVLITLADGKERNRLVLTSTTLEKPKPRIVARGTADAEDAPSVSGDSVWDKIAQCESGGNWHINTGNGYYGGLQFSAQTWHSVGGPGLPHEHSREVQIKYAKILQARSGWGQWSCASKVGVG
ncbi:MAG: transglycosylase family protein [Aeromicrobium erythreum]